jgi:hypothetical protein
LGTQDEKREHPPKAAFDPALGNGLQGLKAYLEG